MRAHIRQAIGFGICLVIVSAAYFSGARDAGIAKQQAADARTLASIMASDAAYWHLEAEEASAAAAGTREAMEALETSTAAAIRAIEADNTELAAEVAKLQGQLQQQSRKSSSSSTSGTKSAVSTGTSAGCSGRAAVTATLADAAAYYGLTAAQTDWIVSTGVRICGRETGGTYDPGAINPNGHYGLFQFSADWGSGTCRHGASGWKLCGTCSCYRFVKVYDTKGEHGIRDHWAETY